MRRYGKLFPFLLTGAALWLSGCLSAPAPAPLDPGLLSQENVDKALKLKTQTEFEELLGPPNSTPVVLDKMLKVKGMWVVAWEDTVPDGDETFTRRLEIGFDERTGEKCAECYGPKRSAPSLLERATDWLTSWLP